MTKFIKKVLPLIVGLVLFAPHVLGEKEAEGARAKKPVPEYTFAFRGTHKEETILSLYEPLVELINKDAAGKFVVRASAYSDFRPFKTGLTGRQFDFLLSNPAETVWAENFGYEVFAKKGDDEKYRGVIVVSKKSSIHDLSELYHQLIAFSTPTALAATLMNRFFLHQNGVNVEEKGYIKYKGSHFAALNAVSEGKAVAACTWWPAWQSFQKKEPEMAGDLEVRWSTPPLVNWGVVARDDVPEQVRESVKKTLLSLPDSEKGAAFLKELNLSRFETAESRNYEPVRQLIQDYEAVFGRIFF